MEEFVFINFKYIAMTLKTQCPGAGPEIGASSGAFQAKAQQAFGAQMPYSANVNSKDVVKNKPIMGFFYSVSKTSMGEYWPLYIGQNSIGRNADCSICLAEATVSEHHADLVIRRMHHNGAKSGVLVFVQDSGSTCGTMVNGNSLGFEPCECKHGDIITIGENYELYFVLLDPDAIGIAPKEEFTAIDATHTAGKANQSAAFGGWGGNPFNHEGQPSAGYTGPKGTVGGAPSPFASSKTGIFTPEKK